MMHVEECASDWQMRNRKVLENSRCPGLKSRASSMDMQQKLLIYETCTSFFSCLPASSCAIGRLALSACFCPASFAAGQGNNLPGYFRFRPRDQQPSRCKLSVNRLDSQLGSADSREMR